MIAPGASAPIVCLVVALVASRAEAQPLPPIDLPDVGTFRPPRPIERVSGNNLTVLVDGEPAGVGISRGERGACAYENALVGIKLGTAANKPFADGWWPTVFESAADDTVYGCLDLREGYLTVLVNPAGALPGVQDLLAEVRRAAHERHGAPITNATDPMVLPRTQQQVSARWGAGEWKVVDGEGDRLPGGDVLVSTARLGGDGTMYSIGVREEPCPPGDTVLPPVIAEPIFPAKLGTVWVDAGEYRLRWRAWACVTHGGAAATITVLAPIAGDAPPEARDLAVVRPMIERIVESYGIELYAPPRPGRSPPRADGFAAGYLGILSLAPAEGDRSLGFLVGFDLRFFTASAGIRPGFALDLELGRGGGELLGEIRAGAGLGLGPLEALVGASVGSIGPAAALDGYAQVGATLRLGRPRLWLGALRAIGVGGPDHDQLDAKLVIPGRDDAGVSFGVRYLRFGDTAPELEGGLATANGSALMVTVGGAVASTR